VVTIYHDASECIAASREASKRDSLSVDESQERLDEAILGDFDTAMSSKSDEAMLSDLKEAMAIPLPDDQPWENYDYGIGQAL
jgi:hypothetical protein